MTKYNYCPHCGRRMSSGRRMTEAHRQGRQSYCGLIRPQIYLFQNTLPQLFIMAATKDRIDRFQADKALLGLSDKDIAKKMRMSGPRFEAYTQGAIPITDSFLKKFYGTFGFDLGRRWQQFHTKDFDTKTISQSTEDADLENRVTKLENALDQLSKTQQMISMDLLRLDGKLDKTVDKRLGKIEKMVTELMGLVKGQNSEALTDEEKKAKKKEKEVDQKLRRTDLPRNIPPDTE